jgi:biopolymer transport protein ExbD
MRSKLFLLLAALMIYGQAAADFKTIAKAYEVPLTELGLPVSLSGSLSFRECDTCERFTVRIDANTRFLVNQEATTLDDFRQRVRGLSNAAERPVTVLHDLESNTVIEVHILL